MHSINEKMPGYIKQAFEFFLTSGIGWIIDFTVYGLLGKVSLNVFLSNLCSSFCGVTFVFIASTRKNFTVKESKVSLKQKYVIYLLYQVLLILVVSLVLKFIYGMLQQIAIPMLAHNAKLGAKILVTPFTMIINFIVMKMLIEKI